MTHFDAIVIGGGTGNKVASYAADDDTSVALVEPGPIGGTCLNRGCNPSKMLIQHANAANGVREAGKYDIDASLDGIDFPAITAAVNGALADIAASMKESKRADPNLTLVEERVEFVGDRTVETKESGERLSAEKVVVAAGSRPVVPPIDGIDDVEYVTSDEAVRLEERPDRLVVIGGGYVAAELGYFYEAMGTDVALVEMMDSLLPREDGEVAAEFTEIARERHDVYTGYRVTEATQSGDEKTIRAESKDGDEVELTGDELLVAAGRRPNTDTLDVAAGGIETDDRGHVVTNEFLETSAENVWAQGDIADNFMFKHSADYETEVVKQNAFGEGRRAADFTAMPHAIFTEPQVGGVGRTEEELQDAGREYVVGTQRMADTPMGRAKKLEHGFVKVLADPEDGEILGCHVLGEEASTLIHEVVVAMRSGSGTVSDIADAVFAHPSLSKVLRAAFRDVEE